MLSKKQDLYIFNENYVKKLYPVFKKMKVNSSIKIVPTKLLSQAQIIKYVMNPPNCHLSRITVGDGTPTSRIQNDRTKPSS